MVTARKNVNGGNYDGIAENGRGIDGTENGGNGGDYIDPAQIGDSAGSGDSGNSTGNSTGKTPGKRGRKPGQANKKKTSPVLEASSIEKILLSVHGMLAGMLKSPIWEIDKEEAQSLGKAIAEVQALYPVAVSDKMLAWVNLGITASSIYIPRIIVNQRLKTEGVKRENNIVEIAGQH